MPAKPSGEIKTITVRRTQKNGDIYVLERRTIYDTSLKRNKILSTKLIHKIPKDSEVPVPTRPKRNMSDINSDFEGQVVAVRTKVGMMEILEHIGTTSGIDAGIYDNTDIGTAQKIISIARYFLACNGQTLPGLLTWQFNHKLPYEDGITEDVYHDLFVQVGRNETLHQGFFANRCASIKDKAVLAYDSTTISTYSENQVEARHGYNKDEDGLKTIKYLTLYSIETRQPVAFTKQPGNLPDVITIKNALLQLSALGLRDAEIVTDNGYYSESNLAELFLAGFDFITLVKTNAVWVKNEIDKHLDDFDSINSVCPFDTSTHGITVSMMREFVKVKKYDNHKTGAKKGTEETFRRRIYLHIYFNPERRVEAGKRFDEDLLELRKIVEEGINVDSFPDSVQKKVKKYLHVSNNRGKLRVSFNEAACKNAKKYHGFFAITANKEKDTFECLRKYRKRETIEQYFETMKRRVDGLRARVWESGTLRGRMFVQFVALCYYECLYNKIRNMKQVLGVKNGDPIHDTAENIKLEKKLKSWLENTPLYVILQWFDAIESTVVSSKLRTKRWNTEITKRDSLFLHYLGVTLPN